MNTLKDFKSILKIKRYSDNTIESYSGLLIAFKKFIGTSQPLNAYSDVEIIENVRKIVSHLAYARSTQNQLVSAIKLFFKTMHDRHIDLSIMASRKEQRKLPVILSQMEVKRLIESTKNKKHHAILFTIYALGLRSGELCNLKLVDMDGERNQIRITAAKGKKDRVVPFPEKLKVLLRQYFQEYKPKRYLFEGRNNQSYSATSLRSVFNKAKKRANIKQAVTLHSLRHAYATHLMDQGIDVRIIKELLGHNSIKTTLIYTHVTNRTLDKVPSPIDFL